MVYLKSWTDFETAVTELYAKSPRKARYCIKFAPKTGQLILKLTDDTTCIMYKTHSAIILNRFEILNLKLLSQISNSKRRPPPQTSTIAETDDPMTGGTGPVPTIAKEGKGREGTPAPTNAGATGTPGGKKKKKGKK